MERRRTPFQVRLLLIIGGEKPYSWAARIGVPKGTLNRMLTTDVTPHDGTLKKICDATGISFEWLKHGTGEANVASRQHVDYGSAHTSPVKTEPVEEMDNRVAGTIAAGSAEVDEAKLALAARVLEEWAAEKGMVVKPERKGAIIAILYKMLMKGAQQKDMETLLRAGNGG